MIRAFAPTVIAMALLAACAPVTSPIDPVTPGDDGPRSCDVTVSFGSYAMGVDRDLKTRILAVVSSDRGVDGHEERPWGREGESDLCIHAPGPGAADRIYDRIAAMIPAHSDRAPTSVTHRDGRSRAATMPGEH